MIEMADSLRPKGLVDIYVTRGKPTLVQGPRLSSRQRPGFPPLVRSCEINFSGCNLIDKFRIKNIILNQGKDRVIETLTTGFFNVIARMAIGDRGTLPSDQTIPKVPTSDLTGLYNEVYRDDVQSTVLNIGTPDTHSVTFIRIFSALDVPIAAFSNQANPIVNEVGLVTIDPDEEPLPRSPVYPPSSPSADEQIFSIRTFKSVPFEAENEIAITIRYTIYID
jgi:hypothetical protein